jgi:hypothetical protein
MAYKTPRSRAVMFRGACDAALRGDRTHTVEASMRSVNQLILRAATRDPQVLARFWASVDRSESAEACWEWQPRTAPGRHPVFRVKHYAVSAARLAWFAATGEFPLAGRMRHTCQNISCVRPDHLEWELGMMSQEMLRATSDGYVPLPAVRSGLRSPDAEALYRRAG